MTSVGITGHQRIPPDALGFISDRIRERLAPLRDGLVGVTALAAGADQLFAALVLELGGSLHVVVPARDYGSSFTEPEDRARFEGLLARARHVETLDHVQAGEEAYMAAGRRIVDLSELLVAVWDGEPARGLGGTGDVVAYAKRCGKQVVIVWPAGATRE